MLEHGGRLRQAASHYQRPLAQWLDLSTGINPNGWPVPTLPAAVWNRLPEVDDDLLPTARTYYDCDSLLALPGSQAAIQTLPRLRAACRVALPAIGYREHHQAWQQAGHHCTTYSTASIDAAMRQADVVVVINPNNPSGERYDPEQLLQWHQQLAQRGGWLLVDEAFMDATPTDSLGSYTPRPGLLVLRSVGKFFGLAGIRAGFLLATPELCRRLEELLGPWAVSHPARWICTQAFKDRHWQRQTRVRLTEQSQRLAQTLQRLNPDKVRGCALFQTLYHAQAETIHQQLARQGLLTRRFSNHPSLLRVGLPRHEADWQRLDAAIKRHV